MAMFRPQSLVAATSIVALLTGCTDTLKSYGEAGRAPDSYAIGSSVDNNAGVQSGERQAVLDLGNRFHQLVPDTINFEFNQWSLDAGARAVLDQQANFIRQFPEVRFKVFGYTDKVGSNAYNYRLGRRRADAVVNYLVSRGVNRRHLQAVVSYGETRPVINTPGPERRNRRAITEVSGFVKDAPLILNGKYAEVVWREYVKSATEFPPTSSTLSELAAGSSSGG